MLKIGGGAALLAAIVAVFVVATQGRDPDLEALEHEGRQYILQLDNATGVRRNLASKAEWDYTSNITKENEEKWVTFPLLLSFRGTTQVRDPTKTTSSVQSLHLNNRRGTGAYLPLWLRD